MLHDILNTNFYELKIVCERAIISLITLFFITKLIGKKQVSDLNLFDYVISISIGNFAAEISVNLDSQVLNGIVSVLIFGFVAYFVSILTMKNIKLRRFLFGTTTLLIEEGKILYKNLIKLKLDINDLLEVARISGYFDLSEIKYALMEANGKISFMPKDEFMPVTIKDMNLKKNNKSLCCNVIIDSKIMHKNLESINKDEIWLLQILKVKGYNDIKNILLATVDCNEKINIYEKNNEDTKIVLE